MSDPVVVQTQTSPTQTGVSALGGAAIGPVITWLCTVCHVTPPPDAVSATIGALLIMGAHFLVNSASSQAKDATISNQLPK